MRYQLGGLSHPVQIQVKYGHYQAYDGCQYGIGCQAVLENPSHISDFMLTEQAAYYGSQSIGKACTEDNGKVEHVVHEAGSRKFRRAVVSDHQRIGKSQYDDSYLSDDDREPQ